MNKVVLRSISGVAYILLILAGLLINKYFFAGVFGLIACFLVYEFIHTTGKSMNILLPGLVYILASMCILFLMGFTGGQFDGTLLLCFFIMIWCSDVGAFCVGSLFGQKAGSRKLAPKISPNKSWVGFWGGLVFTVAAALILHAPGLLVPGIVHCILLAVVIHCTGVCGDLLESAWKRHFGLKDSGNIIPGHGGFLDRFDSSLAAIPAGALYLLIFSLI